MLGIAAAMALALGVIGIHGVICRWRHKSNTKGGVVKTRHRNATISDRGEILIFDKGVGVDLREGPHRRTQSRLVQADCISAIGMMVCSISHDMRHSLAAIYANAEFLERHDICRRVRAELLLEIQEAVRTNWSCMDIQLG
jgi:C4-dicarboxylate-specific signal transduction histidine kinase